MVAGPKIRTRAIVVQQKTGRPVQFEITSDVRASLLVWLERRGGSLEDYGFPSRVDHSRHMSTRQYAGLVDEWVTAVGLRSEEYGTHSLRRTKASMIYKATGNIRANQILLGHSKIENTVLSRRRRGGRAPPGGANRDLTLSGHPTPRGWPHSERRIQGWPTILECETDGPISDG